MVRSPHDCLPSSNRTVPASRIRLSIKSSLRFAFSRDGCTPLASAVLRRPASLAGTASEVPAGVPGTFTVSVGNPAGASGGNGGAGGQPGTPGYLVQTTVPAPENLLV